MTQDAMLAAIMAERDALSDFVALLKQEELVLIAGDTDLLSRLVASSFEQSQKIASITQAREQLMKSNGLSIDRDGMELWLKSHPQSRKDWDELLRLTEEARLTNESNGRLIDLRLTQNQQALSVLQAAAQGSASLYGPDGLANMAAKGRGFISA